MDMSKIAKKAKDFMSNPLQNISGAVSMDTNTKFIIAVIFLIIVITYGSYRISYILKRKPKKQCNDLNNIYSINTNIKPINQLNDPLWMKPLNFYYIKTSYNSCSIGSYRDDFVDTCILNQVIGQGVRSFDFEIFNINNEAVVSTSSTSTLNPYMKNTYNQLPFSQILNILVTEAMMNTNNLCPNPTDPLFISLRMNTNNMQVYDNIASNLQNYTNQYLLAPEYNCANITNFGSDVTLDKLFNKMVVIVFPTNSTILQSTNLYEFTNINAYGNPYFNYMTYYNAVNDNSSETITDAKTQLTYITPSLEYGTPTNPDPSYCLSLGVQFIGMSYQIFDSFLQAYEYFFNTAGNAFIMKNPSLLPVSVVVDVPNVDVNPMQTCITLEANGVSQTFGDCNSQSNIWGGSVPT